MPKFVVRGADKPEEIVEFWLEQDSRGGVDLWARGGEATGGRIVAEVTASGMLRRIGRATGIPGLQYDDKCRIKEVE